MTARSFGRFVSGDRYVRSHTFDEPEMLYDNLATTVFENCAKLQLLVTCAHQ